ncbi:hypothetical protein Back11_06850 [Paenibacillus baekrokdamisoli]|uniref:Uncharacterized protein n=1 Tax=Paenibacillus baekrokdamisoli TaxID=1712516 RepID=A0A3G9IKB6_9BACL|nr:hypothetical protein Back11_06850 [Paenibacillus baekrokdamisoli]
MEKEELKIKIILKNSKVKKYYLHNEFEHELGQIEVNQTIELKLFRRTRSVIHIKDVSH